MVKKTRKTPPAAPSKVVRLKRKRSDMDFTFLTLVIIMVCVGIYAALVNGFVVTNNLHTTIFTIAAYTVVLCFSLFKTGNMSKSIFNAH